MVTVSSKDKTKPKIGRRKDLLLFAASKENTGDLCQSSVSQKSEIESFKLRAHAYSGGGFKESKL